MKRYKLTNNIFGWICFVVAAITYLSTIEPTASFWDCSEFIATSFKFEVGHPPGAPFFSLTAKFFSLFAPDKAHVAMMVNSMSALLSAMTILFLFWSITRLVKKLVYNDPDKEISTGQLLIIMGSGLVGALAYTFTDTFWFSAVEGEVYAYSSMFTALVFWLILKWESNADNPSADKWIVFTAYAMGLSIGVHILNLLCIPAIVLVYYFKKAKNVNAKGIILSLLGSFVLLALLMYGIIPGFTKVGGWFELLFINKFGCPYNTGAIIYIAILILSIIWALFETYSTKGSFKRARLAFILCMALSGLVFATNSILIWIVLIIALLAFTYYCKAVTFRLMNTCTLCLLVILIGYSSFTIIPLRSFANPPLDEDSPENVFSFASYLNREQYGDSPLFYGRTYASKIARDDNGNPVISNKKNEYGKIVKTTDKQKDKYVVTSSAPNYKYTNSMLFPRMYSTEGRHLIGYRMWGGITDTSQQPTMFDNLKFFFNYQLNYMYFRYFMWNFSGRQNDIEGTGNLSNGNWITGIKFIDQHILGRGPQNLPPFVKDNKGHNTYFALPFILGILGIIYQLRRRQRGEQQFLITFMLFFMTGIAIILYLNQQPFEPRERDYAYAGSFYAFCIWIGCGVAWIWNAIKNKTGEVPAAIIATVVALIFVPIRMACQNWNDHDRSHRYVMKDFGMNYLTGCEKNSIIFPEGDNDTFPLWYLQEVEGFRTDVRVCNLSYLQTDWYVDQMKRQAYDSSPLPISWTKDRYTGSRGQAAYVLSKHDIETALKHDLKNNQNQGLFAEDVDLSNYYDTAAFKNSLPLEHVLNILKTKDEYHPKNPFGLDDGVIVPSSIYTMPIDIKNVDWKNLGSQPQSQFTFNLGNNKNAIYRQEIMILEMLYNINKDNWKRPIYYAGTIGTPPMDLNKHSTLEGINYRIVPGIPDTDGVNTKVMFENMVNKYKWGGINNPKVYLDENILRMCRSYRIYFNYLISALLNEGDKNRALIALDKCVKELPGNTIPRGGESVAFANDYFELNQPEKANKIVKEIEYQIDGALNWYIKMNPNDMSNCSADIREFLYTKLQLLDLNLTWNKAKFNKDFGPAMAMTIGFLNNGIMFDSRNHPLDVLMRISMRNYSMSQNATEKKNIWDNVQKIGGLMQRFAPELLQKYTKQ